jgi:DNA-binding transcriptional ArsR family regulator
MSNKFREYRYCDPETGQNYLIKVDENDDIVSKIAISEKRDTSDYFAKGEFFTMSRRFEMFLEEKYHEYNKLEFGILGWLRKNIDDDNYVKWFRQEQLAEVFKTKQPHISASLKKLEKDGIIYKDKEKGLYVFNPKYIRYIFGDDGKEPVEKLFEEQFIEK